MKWRLFLNVTLVMIVAVITSSCLNNEDVIDIQTKAEEMVLLNQYISNLESQDYDVDTTDLGVYYVTIEEGEGEYPEEGDTLTVGYSGYFIDGLMFDSSDIHTADGKYEFVLGETPMIAGWNDGVKQIQEGGKIQFVIPSELAYESSGSGAIGPNQSLIFVIKLFDLKKSEE